MMDVHLRKRPTSPRVLSLIELRESVSRVKQVIADLASHFTGPNWVIFSDALTNTQRRAQLSISHDIAD